MSDYYYFEDSEEEFEMTPVLGDDYIQALISIAKKYGLKITDKMILEEIGYKLPKKNKMVKLNSPSKKSGKTNE